MSPKYTRCPNCRNIYALSVTQLTITQGLVNCPHCDNNFNALRNLYFLTGSSVAICPKDTQDTDQANRSSAFAPVGQQPQQTFQAVYGQQTNQLQQHPRVPQDLKTLSRLLAIPQLSSPSNALANQVANNDDVHDLLNKNDHNSQPVAQQLEQHMSQQPAQLGVFYAKTQQSNLNLRTYLNHLGLSHQGLNHLGSSHQGLNQQNRKIVWQPVQQPDLMLSSQESTSLWRYYLFWGCVNVLLLLILILQIAWFNPKILQSSLLFGHWFEQICQILVCSS